MALSGRDMIGIAETGSGKTLAFLLYPKFSLSSLSFSTALLSYFLVFACAYLPPFALTIHPQKRTAHLGRPAIVHINAQALLAPGDGIAVFCLLKRLNIFRL